MRAAAVQLQSTPDRDRNLAAADRLTRDAAAARAPSSSCCPRSGPRWVRPSRRSPPPSRSTARSCSGRTSIARELGIDLVAGSFSERVERRRARRATRRSTSAPTASCRRATARSTCSTSRSAGASTRSPSTRRRARRSCSRETADGNRPRPDDLLRRPLPRALPDPRRPRRGDRHRPGRVHVRHHARPLGGPAARPRDRGPGVRRRRQPDRRARAGHPLRRALDDRRPLGRRARDRRRTPRRSSSPSSTSSARRRSAARCPRWPTAGPRRTAGPTEVHA